MKLLSQIDLFDPNTGSYKGFGPLGLENSDPRLAPNIFMTFISTSIGLISIIAIIWFVFIIITSGISYMSAGADQKVAEGSRKKITNGLIGLFITIFGIFLINLFGQILNIPSILNIPVLLEAIDGQ